MKALLTSAILASLMATTALGQGVRAKAAREAAEFLTKKFAKEAAEEGSERLAGRIARSAASHGDEVYSAVRKVGPKALKLADDAGEQSPRVLRLLAKHGDEAADAIATPGGLSLLARHGDGAIEAMIRHPGVAGPVIEGLGEPSIKAMAALGPQGGRRLAMMAESGELAAMGRADDLLAVVGRTGDRGMDFIWRNKAALAVGVALAAFLKDPEPFIDGTARLGEAAAEHVVAPAISQVGDTLGDGFASLLAVAPDELVTLLAAWAAAVAGMTAISLGLGLWWLLARLRRARPPRDGGPLP